MIDTSPLSIKMLETAEEIQKLYNPNEVSFLWDSRLRNDYDHSRYSYKEYRIINSGPYHIAQHIFTFYDRYEWSAIWIPRIDQLLTTMKSRSLQETIYDLYYFSMPLDQLGVMPQRSSMKEAEELDQYIKQFSSMEQLVLAFVMEESYNKIWNTNNWVEILNA